MHQPVTATEIFVICLLAGWLLLTILYALFNRRVAAITRRYDLFRWLSAYQLFSTTASDYRLLYRDQLTDDSMTEWTVISLTPVWKPWHLLWFPQKLVTHTIHSLADDLVTGLAKRKGTTAAAKINERFLYRALQRYVQQQPCTPGLAGRQFRIDKLTGLPGSPEYSEAFISNFHQP
ncbi:MAG: hypothetical protein ABW019_11905 [Chitinophagaceae bacterium]